jgi:hypothetical protein
MHLVIIESQDEHVTTLVNLAPNSERYIQDRFNFPFRGVINDLWGWF